MTTCLVCTKTCHKNCLIADDDEKDGCGAMNWKTEEDKKKDIAYIAQKNAIGLNIKIDLMK